MTSPTQKNPTAVFGGSFKPPTAGHLSVVKKALEALPNVGEFIIYVGGGERGGISQELSIKIWEIYLKYLPSKVKLIPAHAPIGEILRLAKNNPQGLIYFVIGSREGREDDELDIKQRTKNIDSKYPNMVLKIISTPDGSMSGSNARKALKQGIEEFSKYLPSELSENEKEEIFNILDNKTLEELNEDATYSKEIDYKSQIKSLTKWFLNKHPEIKTLPKVIFKHGDVKNAKDFFGKTAYYDPTNQTIVLYTEGRHPKDLIRSYSHEIIHYLQDLENRLGNIQTTNTNEDEGLVELEKEAYLNGNMNFRNWTDSLNESISYDELLSQTEKGDLETVNKNWDVKESKDIFGLNEKAISFFHEVINLKEGKYDSLVTKLTNQVIKGWKHDVEEGNQLSKLKFKVEESGLKFNLEASLNTKSYEFYDEGGSFASKPAKIQLIFKVPKEDFPQIWEKVSYAVSDILRHEIEHLTQDGLNKTPSKDFDLDKDNDLRDKIETGKNPYWKYFTLPTEIDAMLYGMYTQAKKSKKPMKDVIDAYLEDQELTSLQKDKILSKWRTRSKSLSLPLFESFKLDNPMIYVDMDGVIADFDGRFTELSQGISPGDYRDEFGVKAFWDFIDEGPNKMVFWKGIPPLPEAKKLIKFVSKYNYELLTAPSIKEQSVEGKKAWLDIWVNKGLFPSKPKMNMKPAKEKHLIKPKLTSNDILIDDREETIINWNKAGGIGILFKSTTQTIKELKELGL